jgi:hypothetical protein
MEVGQVSTVFSFLAVRIAFLFITVASFSTLVITNLARWQPPFDPFIQYEDVMPGQSRERAVAHGFRCQFNGPPHYDQFCLLTPETGVFSEIQVDIAHGTSQVNKVVFKPREKIITLGDLMLLWGQPQRTIYGRNVNFRWLSKHVLTVFQDDTGHFSYLLPVIYVAFG